MIRVADYIMKRIEEEGVKHVFYVPGGQCVYLTDALRRNENLQGVSMHHEQSASMAALSYSLYNENFGACLVTTGCAGTNTMTGVLHAWQDSIPCIFVSGQQSLKNTIWSEGLPLRQVGVQEADIVGLVSPITKYAVMITDAKDIAYHLDKAIYLAREGRRGPVWIDVPLDIQNAMIDEEELRRYLPECEETPCDIMAEDLDYVFNCIEKAVRPVILAGQGIRSAKAKEELRTFAEKFDIPVVFTRFAADLMDYRNPYNFGVAGSFGANREANFIVQNSDLLISIGSRLSVDTTGGQREDFAREAKIIVVDIDKVEHSKKGVRIDKLIVGDAKKFFDGMIQEDRLLRDEENAHKEAWLEKCRHWKNIFKAYPDDVEEKDSIDLMYFLEKLSEKFPENSALVSDAGMTAVATCAHCDFKDSDRLIHSFAQGEMGYSLPGAIGVACVCEGTTFAVSGDGSFMMNLQELQTVVRNQFNLKIVINNNNGYSGVRHGQKAHFRGKSIGTDSSNGVDFPDYEKIAQAFGIPYCKAETVQQLNEKLDEMMQTKGPFFCEVMCDPEQFDLHNALVMYGKRKFGFRPIEDQSPFIERDVFFEEMIIEPMETSHGKPV